MLGIQQGGSLRSDLNWGEFIDIEDVPDGGLHGSDLVIQPDYFLLLDSVLVLLFVRSQLGLQL